MREKYIVYKRKSTESEDKQILSLESQARVIREDILETASMDCLADYDESKTAKQPGRELFNRMCEQLEAGEAKYIVCWSLNRLARNPVDGGRIMWLVQKHGVKILTPGKTYTENDSMLMHVEFAMSNEFIRDLSKSTKRGMEDKLRKGQPPFLAPIGYTNNKYADKGLKDILVDEERFHLVRRMWDLLLTENYSVQRIYDIATHEWGLRQRNGRPISRNRAYYLFQNLYYTGKYKYQGAIHQGNYQPMVTQAEFDKAQRILGQLSKPQVSRRELSFAGGLIKCSCGQSITAEERLRHICSSCRHKYNAEKGHKCPKCNSNPLHDDPARYCYYHCIKKLHIKCTEGSLVESKLLEQFAGVIESIQLPQEFSEWAIGQLKKAEELDNVSQMRTTGSISKAIKGAESELDSLLARFTGASNADLGLISEEQYRKRRDALLLELKKLQESLDRHEGAELSSYIASDAFDFSKQAVDWLKYGDPLEKRTVVKKICSNPVLSGKELSFTLKHPYDLCQSAHLALYSEQKRFEPVDFALVEGKFLTSSTQFSFWGG